jgi:hypothetical protein
VVFTELTRLGGDQARGFFMSRPVPAAQLDLWLSNRRVVYQCADIPPPGPSTGLG